MLIHFTDVIGLEVRENSIVMDVKSRPKFEKKVHTKDRENGKTGGGKWTEENMHVEEGSSPNRIELVMVGRREPVTAKLQEVLSKVPSLKKAINRGLATVYDNSHSSVVRLITVRSNPSLAARFNKSTVIKRLSCQS